MKQFLFPFYRGDGLLMVSQAMPHMAAASRDYAVVSSIRLISHQLVQIFLRWQQQRNGVHIQTVIEEDKHGKPLSPTNVTQKKNHRKFVRPKRYPPMSIERKQCHKRWKKWINMREWMTLLWKLMVRTVVIQSVVSFLVCFWSALPFQAELYNLLRDARRLNRLHRHCRVLLWELNQDISI